MYQNIKVRLQNLLLSLSDALDLANPIISQHQTRTAFIAWQISRAMNLPAELESDLFIGSLLHDVGALSPEDKMTIHMSEVDHPEPHCRLGHRLLKTVQAFCVPAEMVRLHHTAWEKHGLREPDGILLGSQIIHLGDTVERMIDRNAFILHQSDGIVQAIRDQAGSEIAPQVVDSFLSLVHREDFWLDLVSPRLYSILLNNGPCRSVEIDLSNLLSISEMFRAMIDFRSRFTATHSSGVAAAACKLSGLFGFTEKEAELMEVAGNLHDLGKLAIPNRILAKPGRLTPEEFAVMRQHTYHTYTVLNTIGGIQQIAEWAAFHHEHLDGSGYPFHLTEKDLSINSRIMAVADTFTALTEDRPYRSAMQTPEVKRILNEMVGRHWLDQSVVQLLMSHFDEVYVTTRTNQQLAKQYYEENFSPLQFSEEEMV